MSEASTASISHGPVIGPGRVILVVGPSGAGKDTLLGLARIACADDDSIVFARRVVTREASAFEDNEQLSPEAFREALQRGEFAVQWEAHGHCYGLPRAIDDDIRAGRTVVANVSRTIIEAMRRGYSNVEVVAITAPPEVLAKRLAMRARTSDGLLDQRLQRAVAGAAAPDQTIVNIGSAEFHAGELVQIIRGWRPGKSSGVKTAAMSVITTVEQLEAIYGTVDDAATVKVAKWITPFYRRLIEKSPFAMLATSGPEGLDCSPRGDVSGCVRIHDERTLMMPDRRGNNRIDSLRNIVRDPRVALLFLIPGSRTTIRVNGKAQLYDDGELLASFKMEGRAPRTVIVMTIEEIYFQCARAIVRSDLWNPGKHVDPKSLPTPGQILAEMSDNRVGGEGYDRAWPERARQSMW